MKVSVVGFILLLGSAIAQQSAYGQCEGQSWAGATTCVSGYYCSASSIYYSQCILGTSSSKAAITLSTSTKTSSSTQSAVGSTASDVGYSKPAGRIFTVNGKNTYFEGTNSFWIGFLTNNADVDLVMTGLAATGLKVLRVWGFNDVASTPGTGTSSVSGALPIINTDANGLQRLDYVVASAAAHGIQLIINFVNNWTDYGGMAATVAQAQYRLYISTVVTRYKTSPAIFAWELANEPRCTGCNLGTVTAWAGKTSAYIKSLDANHMVTLGDEGWLNGGGDGSYPYQNNEGIDFAANLAIPTIDFGTFHLYPESWSQTIPWRSTWISQHDAIGKAVGKPVILEEYGTAANHVANEGPWQATVSASGLVGDMFWQYDDTLSTGKSSDDGNTVYYGTSDYATLATKYAAAMNSKSVT